MERKVPTKPILSKIFIQLQFLYRVRVQLTAVTPAANSYISHIILPTHLINIGRALYTNTSADTPAQFYILVVPLWLVRVQIVFLNSL